MSSIDQPNPGQFLVREHILSWLKILRMVEAPGGDVDLTRTIAYLVSERRAADVTKSSYRTGLGPISF